MPDISTLSPLLTFRDIWVEYGDNLVLERVNLSINPGEFVSIIGPSGAGKSTFLRLVSGQEAPSRGQVSLDGKPLRAEPGPDRGIVFQQYSVFPHLTALQNVMLGLDFARAPITGKPLFRLGGEDKKAALGILERVGLKQAVNKFPAQLSGGMRQRLAIAQALIMKPRILLLDEPFGALDPGVKADAHALILELWQEHGLTIMMVTHDIGEAFKLGTRVLAFDKRRHDAQAPNRYGACPVQDLKLDRKTKKLSDHPAEM